MSAAIARASPTPPPPAAAASSHSVVSSTSSISSAAPAASGPQTWLLKLPVFVAEQFRRALQQQQQQNAASSSSSTQSAPLATLHVSYTADGEQQLLLRYSPTEPMQPKEFVVRPRNKRHMLVFTEKQQTAATQQQSAATSTSPSSSAPASASSSSSAVTGATPAAAPQCKYLSAVSLIADVVPADTASYRSLVSRRTASFLSHSNTQRLVETDGFITPQLQQEMERKRRRDEERKEERREAKEAKAEGREREREPAVAGSKGKRVRGSREEVESQLLRLFSESRFLSLRQLQDATQQPVTFLKEVMADMCVRETRGDNKDKYQLSEKYRIDD